MKKLTLIFALGLGLSTAAFAGAPKTNDVKSDAKTTAATEITTSDPIVEWFHFNGNALSSTELADPTKYSVEDDPECDSENDTYRCDIQILSQTDQSKPDLTKTVMATRKRSTPTD